MRTALILILAACATWSAETAAADPAAAAFFTERIHPQLVEHCFECHGNGKRKGGLHADSLAGLLKGGYDQGPAVIPGDVARSPLLVAIRWESDDDDLHMPPRHQLPAAVIRDFEHWVAIGAPWPETVPAAAPATTTAPAAKAGRPPLLGRVHPIIVHMPIACLSLAVLAELLVMLRGPVWKPTTALLVAVGAAGAVAAVVSGTWLAGDQDPLLLQRHQILGWMTMCGALVAAAMLLLGRWVPMRRWPLLAVLLLTAALVTLTGHIGGKMSWGVDWLPL